jgi:hypothetical protein
VIIYNIGKERGSCLKLFSQPPNMIDHEKKIVIADLDGYLVEVSVYCISSVTQRREKRKP